MPTAPEKSTKLLNLLLSDISMWDTLYHTVHGNNEKCFDMWLEPVLYLNYPVWWWMAVFYVHYTHYSMCASSVMSGVEWMVVGTRTIQKNTSRCDEILGSTYPLPFRHVRFGGPILIFVSWGLKSFGNMSRMTITNQWYECK